MRRLRDLRLHVRWRRVNCCGAIWFGDGKCAIGGEVELPATFVDQMMVLTAKRYEIVDVGQTLL